MNVITIILAQLRRLFRPRIWRLSIEPSGWQISGKRGHLESVRCWAVLENGVVLPVIFRRRRLHLATGSLGYVTPDGDLQASAPEVPPMSLEEAANVPPSIIWTDEGLAQIRGRLVAASRSEWARAALDQFDHAPRHFVRNHLSAVVEEATTTIALIKAAHELRERVPAAASLPAALAALGLDEREWLTQAGLTFDESAPNPAINPADSHAEGGKTQS